MSEFVAWDGKTYPGLPPAGWRIATDGRWWPPPSERAEPPSEVTPPAAAVSPEKRFVPGIPGLSMPSVSQFVVWAILAGSVAIGAIFVLGQANIGPLAGEDQFTEAARQFKAEAPGQVGLCCEEALQVTLGEDGELDPTATLALLQFIEELGFPDSVVSRMDTTRALDGTQSAEGDDAIMYWNYHPDNGLNIVFEEK